MILPLLLAFDVSWPAQCVIDRCEGDICIVETPEGTVEFPKRAGDHEGKEIVCPVWLVEPTFKYEEER